MYQYVPVAFVQRTIDPVVESILYIATVISDPGTVFTNPVQTVPATSPDTHMLRISSTILAAEREEYVGGPLLKLVVPLEFVKK